MTPSQFQALSEQYNEEQEFLNYRAGLAPHIIESALTAKGKKPRAPLDYFKPSTKKGVENEGDAKAQMILAKVQTHNALAEIRQRREERD